MIKLLTDRTYPFHTFPFSTIPYLLWLSSSHGALLRLKICRLIFSMPYMSIFRKQIKFTQWCLKYSQSFEIQASRIQPSKLVLKTSESQQVDFCKINKLVLNWASKYNMGCFVSFRMTNKFIQITILGNQE